MTTHDALRARIDQFSASAVIGDDDAEQLAPQPLRARLPEHLGDLRKTIQSEVAGQISGSRLRDDSIPHAELEANVAKLVDDAIVASGEPLSRNERDMLRQRLLDELLGLGPMQCLLDDASVTEVMVNGPDEVWVERSGILMATDVHFDDEEHLRRVIDRIVSDVGRRIDESSPMVDARLVDGSRVNAVVPPLALRGSYLTIRRFRDMPLNVEDLIRRGTLTPKASKFLELAVRGGANVLVSGGTGTGKTTTLNVLSSAIPEDERIVTIEDAAELRLSQTHVLPMESRPANAEGAGQVSIRDLVRNSLRMRPDRIIVGECRGPEAVDMLQAMNTGHDGCMTTIHANTPRDAISRLETLVLTSGIELPARAIREQIASAFDLVVQLERLVDGTRRIIAISDVVGMEGGVVSIQDLFVAKAREDGDVGGPLRGVLRPTGVIPQFLDKLLVRNVEIPRHVFQDGIGGETERRAPLSRATTRT